LATAAIGLIPTFASIGVAAAFILFGLRMVQGCAWAGVRGRDHLLAEHVSDERRGYYTGWLQTSPPGHRGVLMVIVGTRRISATTRSTNGMAIPFLISFLLVMMAIYIGCSWGRRRLPGDEGQGRMVKNPWREAFLSANIRYILSPSWS
jgi:hypothetical protein